MDVWQWMAVIGSAAFVGGFIGARVGKCWPRPGERRDGCEFCTVWGKF